MELFGCDDFTLKALFSCFPVDSSKTELFENDCVTVSKSLRANREILKTATKKTFAFSKENGYVWTGPDSVINLDANTR